MTFDGNLTMPSLRTFALRAASAALLLGGVAGITIASQKVADPGYQVVERWNIGGTGGWDYLTMDSPKHRLFISRGDHVDVVDVTTGKVTGTIPDTPGVHGVALAPDLKRGWTSNGKGNSITEFDYDTLEVLRTVADPGVNPDAILFDAPSQHLFAFNGKSKDAVVYDAKSMTLIAQFPVPDKPEFAQADGKGHVFVNIESEAGQMIVIDAAKPAITATWPLPGCATPSGLAIDRAHSRLFSVCDGKVMAVTDATNGRQIARVKVGDGPDAAEFDAAHGLVFSSNGDGTLTVVHEATPKRYTVASVVKTQKGARTMAFDAGTRRVYLVTADFGPPPAPTAEQPHPRPVPVPGTFTVLVAAPH